MLGRFGVATLGVAAMLAMVPAKADAALLTITDTFGGSNTVWTLNIASGCTTCTAILTGNFLDPDGAGAGVNGYTGTFIDSVQFSIDGATGALTFLAAPDRAMPKMRARSASLRLALAAISVSAE